MSTPSRPSFLRRTSFLRLLTGAVAASAVACGGDLGSATRGSQEDQSLRAGHTLDGGLGGNDLDAGLSLPPLPPLPSAPACDGGVPPLPAPPTLPLCDGGTWTFDGGPHPRAQPSVDGGSVSVCFE